MSLKEFSKIYHDWQYRGSTVPPHARPFKKFGEGSANELTNTILAYFKWKAWKAWRQASEGRFLSGKTVTNVIGQVVQVEKARFISRGKAGGKGSADVTCTVPPLGRRLEVEIKFGKDRQSEDQKIFQREIEASGGIYLLVRSWDDFYAKISSLTE